MDKTVAIEFVGNAGGLIGAINSSLSAMTKMESQSKSLANSIVSTVKSTLAPVALAVASAFAAKKALGDFAESNLPGAAAFKKSVKSMQGALGTLSSAIGEFLAPMAQRTNGWIESVAKKLAPMVRIFTAFTQSAIDFAMKLGENILKAFKPLMPTVFGVFNKIGKLFSGGADWDKRFAAIRKSWNKTWDQIIRFLAPILTALARLIETTFVAIGEIANVVFAWMKGALASLAESLGVDLAGGAGGAADAMLDMAEVIKQALLTAIAAVDFTVKNWRLSFKIIAAFAELTVLQIKRHFMGLAVYASDLFANVGADLWTVLSHYAAQLLPVFKVLAENIKAYFSNLWDDILRGALKNAIRIGILIEHPIQTARHPKEMWDMATRLADVGAGAYIPKNAAKQQELPGIAGLPAGALKGLPDFHSVPESPEEKTLQNIYDALKTDFGNGLAEQMKAALKDAAKDNPKLIHDLKKDLPDVHGYYRKTAGVAGGAMAGPGGFQFGTAAAFQAERALLGTSREHLKVAKMSHSEMLQARSDRKAEYEANKAMRYLNRKRSSSKLAILYPIKLIHDGRDANFSSTFVNVYTQVWRVQTDSALDGPAQVANATGLPARYQAYVSGNDFDYNALCSELTVAPDGDSMKSWIVTARYSTDALQLTASNPLFDVTKTSLSFDVFQRTIDLDIYDQPLVNTIGEPFQFEGGGIPVDDSRPILTIQKNVAYVDLPTVMAYKDSINSSAWRGIAPYCAKMKCLGAGQIQIRNGQQFYELTAEVHLRPDTWNLRVLNLSRSYMQGGSRRFLPNDALPVILDTRDNTIATTSTPAEFRFQTLYIFRQLDFNSILP